MEQLWDRWRMLNIRCICALPLCPWPETHGATNAWLETFDDGYRSSAVENNLVWPGSHWASDVVAIRALPRRVGDVRRAYPNSVLVQFVRQENPQMPLPWAIGGGVPDRLRGCRVSAEQRNRP